MLEIKTASGHSIVRLKILLRQFGVLLRRMLAAMLKIVRIASAT
jgi:hypothetical protein